MILAISTFSIEVNPGSIFARTGRYETYISRQTGQPLGMFSRQRSAGALEFWGLGFYGVLSKA